MKSTIERYMREVKWCRNGMEYPVLNCWGLVRIAKHEIFGDDLLPVLPHVDAYDKRAVTSACDDIAKTHITECEASAGKIITAWRNRLCVHVGLIIDNKGQLSVLDVDFGVGVRLTELSRWRAKYLRVVCYG